MKITLLIILHFNNICKYCYFFFLIFIGSTVKSTVSYCAVLLVALVHVSLVEISLNAAVEKTANSQHQLNWKRRQKNYTLEMYRAEVLIK